MRVPTSLAARAGAVVAVAAIAVTGATATASASTTPPKKAATTLTVSAAKPVVHKKFDTDVVKGHLTSDKKNVRHALVLLEVKGPKGHWFVIRFEFTGRKGTVKFGVFFKKSITLRLVFPGTRHLARSKSATVKVS